MTDFPDTPEMIGFPPPLLGMQPRRLPVLWRGEGGFAVSKPTEVQTLPDNWYPRTPLLAESINYQAAREKPELMRLGVPPSGATAIYTSEPELTGVSLFATDPEWSAFWRNAYGSEQFSLRIELIADRSPNGDEVDCDLPLARHGRETRVLVSHRTGKKAQTLFRRVESIGRYSLWEANVRFYRMHQVLVHAHEVGIAILGDTAYAGVEPLYLSQLKRSYRPARHKEEAPLYASPAIHLASVTAPMLNGESLTIEAPRPNRLEALLRRLRQYR